MLPDLIAALSPPTAPPGFTPAPGGTATLTGSPSAALFASLLNVTAPPALILPSALAAPLASSPAPPSQAATGLTKVSFLPATFHTGTDPTEPTASATYTLVLGKTEPLAAKPTEAKLTDAKRTGTKQAQAVLAPPLLPLLITPTTEPTEMAIGVTANDAETEGPKDAKKDTHKEPMDTAPAPTPTGELLLPPPPPPFVLAGLPVMLTLTPPAAVPTAATVTAAPATLETVQPTASVPAARLTPEAAPVPSAQPVPLPQVTQAVPLTQAAPPDIPAAAPLPNASLAVTSAATTIAVGESAAPVLLSPPAQPGKITSGKNSADKTPQKDLKTSGARADTNTRTQTELPRLTHLTRKETPTEESSTDESRTDESRTDAGGTQGQGPASTLTLAPTLSAGTTAAPETKALTHTEKLAIVQQLADGAGSLRLSAKPGAAQEMTVQLHPKDWGSLHVTVQIAPNTAAQDPVHGDAPKDAAPKTMTAQIVAETPQVKAALESHTGELHQKLREAGLHLDSITVTVRTPDTSKVSGTTPQGSTADTQGRFQDGSQGSMMQGSMMQGGTSQGSDFGQRLADTGRQDGSLGSSAGPALSGGGATGSQNGSSGGRQGSQTPHQNLRWAGAETEADAAPRWAARQSGAVRLDLRA